MDRPLLVQGDEVWVFAPSNGYDTYKSDTVAMDRARGAFEGMGLKLVFPENLSAPMDSLKWTDPQYRADRIHEAFLTPSCKALLAIAGGTGCAQMIPRLDWDLIGDSPKLVMGYSDVTDFLMAFSRRTRRPSIYTPGACVFGTNWGVEETVASFRSCVMTQDPYVVADPARFIDSVWEKDLEDVRPYAHSGTWVIQEGEAEGQTFTGNIATLSRSMGQRWMLEPDDKVLVLESSSARKSDGLAEDFLRIIEAATDPRSIRGVCFGIFGSATGFKRQNLRDVVGMAVKHLGLRSDIPVVADIGTGHIMPRATIPNLGTCSLRAEAGNCTLTIIDR
jgi:muramoyltetrapeptide carboxypeptidase